ncbi:efflux RND transporter periplasmic adaptor subunit [Vibrio kasasachensis]|uniref:efflux RND transporter periplasmic adaptor subunit n=1 Tax=Vibrio kasasachensis TaxID=2910248 RepID=UPI003D0B715A
MKMNKILPIVFSLGLMVCAGALVIILQPEPAKSKPHPELKQPVTVTLVKPQLYRPVIKLLGTTYARWPVEIKATSSAKLHWLNEKLEPGMLVKRGAILAKIDTTHLKSQLAQAYSVMEQAELNLQREQHERTVALKMLSKKNSSAYARREPQIATAKAELHQAKTAYISAQQHLKDATIVAPFDAVILKRIVSPGQQVEAGELLIKLASSSSLDVYVPVPEQQWNAITEILEQPQIQVIDRQEQKRTASVRYVAPQVDSTSRQRQIVLKVEAPYQALPKLLPNQQLTVEVTLTQRSSVMQIPLSALTRDGQVWTVDNDDKLRLESISVLKEMPLSAFVVFNNIPDQQRRVVTYPLLSMISGTHIAPNLATANDANMENTQ